MPFEATELRISLQKLLIGLILVIVPLSIVGLYITHRSDRSLEQVVGSQYRAVAESVSSTINRFTSDRLIDCTVIANEPSVFEAIAASNKSYLGMTDASVKERTERLHKNWNAAQPDPELKAVLTAPASRTLRQHREIDPRFLRITVADQRGATIAATDKPAVYMQSEEGYWPTVYANGLGAATVRPMLYDAITKTTYIGVAVPVLDADTHQFAGSVYALVSVSGLLGQITHDQINPTAGIIVTKEDGTVVLGPGITLAHNLKSEEYAAVREALVSAAGRQTGYTVTSMRNGSRNMVGFAETGANPENRGLGLIVMVSQNMVETTAPVREVGTFALAMLVLGLLMLTLTGVYVVLHRREEFEDREPLGENLASPVALR